MEKKYQRTHIGEVHYSKKGYKIEVIDGGSIHHSCTILLDDKHEMEVYYSSIKRGTVKNPYHPSVFNKGYIGIGEYKAWINGKHTKVYNTWKGMLERVYDEKYHDKEPTYKDVKLCEEWHNFQSFAKWFEKHYPKNGDKYDLDKDLKSNENKIYSPNTCIFIPQSLNNFMANVYSNNTSGNVGVSWNKRTSKWEARIHIDGKKKFLGLFANKAEASEVYQKARAREVKRWQRYYSYDLPKAVLDNLK
jgi:hypothetical protein